MGPVFRPRLSPGLVSMHLSCIGWNSFSTEWALQILTIIWWLNTVKCVHPAECQSKLVYGIANMKLYSRITLKMAQGGG